MNVGIEERIAALCSSPTGCAFLLVVEENDLPPEVAAQPGVAVHAAALAVNAIDEWKSDHDQIVSVALDNGPRLASLARAILLQQATVWWFAPVDRTAQWVIHRPGETVTPEGLVTPTSPPTSWERYAQKPEMAEYSSTAVDGTCSILAAMEHLAGDFRPIPPIGRVRVRASPQARVFEVNGLQDWRQIATRYPAQDDEDRLVPDWGLVAKEWDAVHLTLGGLLTAEHVRVEDADGLTELQGWAAERTTWLRWCFEDVERLPDLAEPPPAPVDLEPPMKLLLRDPRLSEPLLYLPRNDKRRPTANS